MNIGATPTGKRDPRRRVYSGFNEKVGLDYGERRVCPDVGVEVCDEQLMSVIDGRVVIEKTPGCDK